MRFAVRGFAAALPLLLLAAPVRAQQPFEEGIVEVVAERLPPLTLIVLVDSAGGVLVPVGRVAEYLGIAADIAPTAFSLPRLDGGRIRIDPRARTITVGADTLRLAPAELVAIDDELYVLSNRLADIFEAEVILDLARLSLVLSRRTPFPAQQRIIADQRRAALLARQRYAERRQYLDTVPYLPLTGGAILDWNLATSSLDPLRLSTIRGELGSVLWGGEVRTTLNLELGRLAEQTVRDFALGYHRVFPRGRDVTQVRAGAFVSTGLFARPLRGVEITNRPYTESFEQGSVVVSPDLPAGWEYEVFQGSQLLGYSTTGSSDPVAVPLRAGTTPVQVRMYGPAGQEVVSTLLYQTPATLLPHGRVQYSGGVGMCDGGVCERIGHGDVRWGATSLLTFGGGLEIITDSAGDHTRPYAVGSFSSGRLVTGEATVMPGALYGLNLAAFPEEGSTLHFRASLSRPGFGPISLIPDAQRRWDSELSWLRDTRGTRLPVSSIRLSAAAYGAATTLERWRIGGAGSFGRGYGEIRYEWERFTSRAGMLSGRVSMLAPVEYRGRTWRPLVTGALGLGSVGLRLFEAAASLPLDGNAALHASTAWRRSDDRPTLSLSYSTRTHALMAAIRAVSSPRGGASSAALLSGSVAVAPDRSVTLNPGARTGYAGVHGVAFLDRDGDDLFSPGDELLPGARIMVDRHAVTADSLGRFSFWNAQPYGVTAIAMDSLRSTDPSLTTRSPALLRRLAPNAANRVDLPLIRTRELAGAVTADAEVPTVAGLTLEVVAAASGDVVATTTTFSDGQYYISRVRPGRYILRVAESSLAAIGAAPAGLWLEFEVPAAGDEFLVELPPLHLTRGARGPGTIF